MTKITVEKHLFALIDPIENEPILYMTKEAALAGAELVLDEYRKLAREANSWEDYMDEVRSITILCVKADMPIYKASEVQEFDPENGTVWINYELEEVALEEETMH